MSKSTIQFATESRIHIGLAVSSAERATEFYRLLFEALPTKVREGYARFELHQPPLNLSVIETKTAHGPGDQVSHYGIQVKSTTKVVEMQQRLALAGLTTQVEDSVECCHAVQDKVWIVDPDGHRWEVFVVVDDAPAPAGKPNDDCCANDQADVCCTVAGEPCCGEVE